MMIARGSGILFRENGMKLKIIHLETTFQRRRFLTNLKMGVNAATAELRSLTPWSSVSLADLS